MADKHGTTGFSSVKPIIQAIRTQFEALNYMFFGKWMNFNTEKGKPVEPQDGIKKGEISNSPIVMQRELMNRAEGAVEMRIPIFRQLKALPVMGDEALSNKEEARKINFSHVFIDEIRHGERTKEGNLSDHIMAKYGIPESSRMALMMHYARVINDREIPSAFYKGLSHAVLNSGSYNTTDFAQIKVVSHPNVFSVGQGSQIASAGVYPGSAAYETLVAASVAAVQPTHVLSASVLKALNAQPQIRRIPYLTTKDGRKFRVMVVDPFGMATLRNDPAISAFNNAAFVQGMAKDNPQMTGCEIFYAGWAIFDGGNAVWPVTESAGALTYGPSTVTDLDSYSDYSAYTTFGAMILGDNALFGGIGWDMKWTKEVRDHDAIHALGYSIGSGFSRGDFWNKDDGSTGQYIINDSSAVLFYSTAAPLV